MPTYYAPVCYPDMNDCTRKCRFNTPTGKTTLTKCSSPCSCYGNSQITFNASRGECQLPEGSPPPQNCPGGGNAGGQGTFSQLINVGPGLGSFSFTYEAFTIPDSFSISGSASYSTGSVSGGATVFIPKTNEGSYITVTVTAPLSGTAWNYTVGCTF